VTSYSGLPCTCQVRGTVPELDAEVATHLYRIVQEATHNAVKHARAGQLSIFVEGGRRCLELTVRDDGVGLPEQPPPGGMGLHLMHYRARMIGAALRVEAGPEGGTQVMCTLPLQGRPARCRRATPS
jgi:two-component system sensor kinase FixL